uniref:FAD_binding_7 domain-containing protein n=1 Tax=Macrostomum lignano TaxID=282301 RepID=A0A1I8FJG9_9PLAT
SPVLLKIATRLPQLIRWIITQVDSLSTCTPPRLRERSQQRCWSHLTADLRLPALEHIYSIGKLGKSPNIPVYNPYGKYVVRLFWLGQWRKIRRRQLASGRVRPVPPAMTARFLELWPALLTKALIKVAALEKTVKLLQKLLPEWKPPDEAFVETEDAAAKDFGL